MASPGGPMISEPPKNEQIITEFFAKSLHIILESRCPYVSSRNYSGEHGLSSPSSSSSSSSGVRPRDKWFNLALKDCPDALENIDFWRQSYTEPIVVDVVLLRRSNNWDPLNCSPKRAVVRNLSLKERCNWSSGNDDSRNDVEREKIIERWVLQYESRKGSNVGVGKTGRKRSGTTTSHTLYKKSILLLRSLYATVRLLPAYKVFRDLLASAQIGMYNLCHRVSSFVEPFKHREEAEMQKFVFTPVETSCGRLCVSVLYSSSVSEVSLEPSTPLSPQFIPDYVGSPLTDPLRRFSSGPLPQDFPSLVSAGRRHSWSYDLSRASPPSGIPSPSPTYSESHGSLSKSRSHCRPPSTLPRQQHFEVAQEHVKYANYDEYLPSPIFSPSPSPSPSPPTPIPSAQISKALLRSESAPVGIPEFRPSGILLVNNQILPPSPKLRRLKSNVAKKDVRSGLSQARTAVDKLLPSGKTEAANVSGVMLSSSCSPPKTFSRSSSISFQDDYDDSDFSGPFVVDEDEAESVSRVGSFDQPENPRVQNVLRGLPTVKKSQEAAVAALVCMLRKAPPLHQDLHDSTKLSNGSKASNGNNNVDADQIAGQGGIQQSAAVSGASSGFFPSKTTADALEELHGYRELKKSLLKQDEKPPT